MLDRYLIEHCAPTLASLKTGNLFNCVYNEEKELGQHIDQWNSQLQEKGVSLVLLKKKKGTALIYLYRKSRLCQDLQKPGVERFLAEYGYKNCICAEEAVARLKMRLRKSDTFPHEIGIFLGYPLGDVIGFIKNRGQNCKCCGCWKVYCNEWEAAKAFARFKKCREVYARLWNQGKTVLQLTVAV